MTFHPDDVPRELRTRDAVLRPLTVDHTEIDHAAVMSSAGSLRLWSGTDWPRDGFTVEENREDLAEHEREHLTGAAFTFTVLDPSESECLGCVYVTPLSSLVGDNPELGELGPHAAVVGFWVVDRMPHLAGPLLESLAEWFATRWSFGSVRFSTNTADSRQMSLLAEHGFREVRRVTVPGRRGPYALWDR